MSVFNLFKKEMRNTERGNMQESQGIPRNILPVLQPFNWSGKEHSLTRSLCYVPKLGSTPWLSFAFDAGPIRAYASEASLHTWGITAHELEAVALQNLRDIPAEWQAVELAPKDGKSVKALLCQSETLVAERILDTHFLQAAQDILEDELPVAMIPSRSMLIVMPLAGDLPFRFAKQFYHDSIDALSDGVFCISQGRIAGKVGLEDGQLVIDSAV